MVRVVSERQDASAASRDCSTASCPNGALSMRTVASARLSSGKRDFHDAGAGAEGGERLRRTEQVDQAAADGGVGGRRGGRHHALRIGQHEAPPGGRSPRAAARGRAPPADAPARRRGCAAAVAGARRRYRRRRRARRSYRCRACRRWSSTCTAAPTQMVSRNAMISTGTARRSNGSAVNRRRYAGLAIDCARP